MIAMCDFILRDSFFVRSAAHFQLQNRSFSTKYIPQVGGEMIKYNENPPGFNPSNNHQTNGDSLECSQLSYEEASNFLLAFMRNR